MNDQQIDSIRTGSKQIADTMGKYANTLDSASGNFINYSKYSSELVGVTDEELRQRVNRMNLEQQYARLASNERAVARDLGFVVAKDVIATVGAVVGIVGGTLTIIKQFKDDK